MIYDVNEGHSIDEASRKLLEGNIIIYPTDTLYGFGVDATNTKSIEKLNKIKKRKQVYSTLVNSIDMMKIYSNISTQQEKKIRKYLPGPFTIILTKKCSNLSKLISLNLETIGIRIPKNKFALNLVRELGKPIITTSVNRHGNAALNNIDEIKKVFNNIALFKDNSLNNNSLGSTIIDYTVKPEKILRYGDE